MKLNFCQQHFCLQFGLGSNKVVNNNISVTFWIAISAPKNKDDFSFDFVCTCMYERERVRARETPAHD